MLATFIIAFREFLEAFLIAGVFLGISKKLKLKKEFEITLAILVGIGGSLLVALLTYFFSEKVRGVFTEQNAELLESYLMIFSGLFIAYVVFSLHTIFHKHRGAELLIAHQKLQRQSFDLSLFATIVLILLREGFEIALFTSSTSLFVDFTQNMIGLLMAFFVAGFVGLGAFVAYIKLSLNKVFKVTEYIIILLGASLVQRGITELLEHIAGIHLSDIFSFNLHFLPEKNSIVGHVIQNFTGFDREMSLPRLIIMVVYSAFIYHVFMKRKQTT